mmetsp:Transcript_58169/g.147548  ORF Transcript_58169/g.147548 Transcript_58169/m.147548 type:complete len:304 (-) Transcript_58169:281-1192(-)
MVEGHETRAEISTFPPVGHVLLHLLSGLFDLRLQLLDQFCVVLDAIDLTSEAEAREADHGPRFVRLVRLQSCFCLRQRLASIPEFGPQRLQLLCVPCDIGALHGVAPEENLIKKLREFSVRLQLRRDPGHHDSVCPELRYFALQPTEAVVEKLVALLPDLELQPDDNSPDCDGVQPVQPTPSLRIFDGDVSDLITSGGSVAEVVIQGRQDQTHRHAYDKCRVPEIDKEVQHHRCIEAHAVHDLLLLHDHGCSDPAEARWHELEGRRVTEGVGRVHQRVTFSDALKHSDDDRGQGQVREHGPPE